MKRFSPKLKALCLSAMVGGVITPATAMAEIHALLVGINKYQHIRPLQGAVNDAQAIRDGVLSAGAKPDNIRILLNQQATKAAIKQHWDAMLNRSRPGDTLILTFAGHGGQEPDVSTPRDEADRLDENFQLSGYRNGPRVDNAKQRIVDDELYQWFSASKAKGVKVIFVADVCNSGTLNRSILTDGLQQNLSHANRPPPESAQAFHNKKRLDNLTFLSSAEDGKNVPEAILDGRPHGVLSWAFAQAIKGKADLDKNGISRLELYRYMKEVARQQSSAIQKLGFEPRGAGVADITLIPPQRRPVQPTPVRPVELAVKEGKDIRIQGTKPRQNQADLTWHQRQKVVKNKFGDTVSQNVDSVPKIQAIVDKQRLADFLRAKVTDGHITNSRLLPNAKVRRMNERVTFEIDDIKYPYLTQFNIASDGTIQNMYPYYPTDPLKLPLRPFRLPLNVKPPAGSDLLVSIFSSQPLNTLHSLLKKNDQQKASLTVLSQIKRSLVGGLNYQVSLLESFSK